MFGVRESIIFVIRNVRNFAHPIIMDVEGGRESTTFVKELRNYSQTKLIV